MSDTALLQRYDERLRRRLVDLVTEEVIAEHAANPMGPHGDDLSRVLTYMRRQETEGKLVVFAEADGRTWRVARVLPRGEGSRLELLRGSHKSYERAMHAIFLMRVDELRDSVK